jgi:methylenetetrahydrofolate dehydrogenase (NADP+)/methenyltetrahydrofolate cyclohydrolase
MEVMRSLNGRELAGYIKERQAKQVRSLRQSQGVNPKLAIVVTDVDNPVIDVYMRLKSNYGNDILIDVDIHKIPHADARDLLNKLSGDDSVHAIIVQLPLANPADTDEIIGLINPHKDVDGLVDHSDFEPATALAIMWLLAGYNIDLVGKNVVLVGHGKLVGQPLEELMIDSGVTPTIVDKSTANPEEIIGQADVIVSATGVAGLIKSDMIKHGAVVVDAGVASEGGKTVGDVAPEVFEERDDLTITPTKGGVGPLTVCALFDNVIRAAQKVAEKQSE